MLLGYIYFMKEITIKNLEKQSLLIENRKTKNTYSLQTYKNLCKDRNLPVSGTKLKLNERLLIFLKNSHVKKECSKEKIKNITDKVIENKVIKENVKNEPEKQEIIKIFRENVKGKKLCNNSKHCGSEGHELEKLMGIRHNCDNAPDLNGYEQKKESPVTTFIDKQTDKKFYEGQSFKNNDKHIKKLYWKTFERTNSKPNRIGGWKLDKFDIDGQCIKIDDQNNIKVVYNYNEDKRNNKENIVSIYYKNNEEHLIGIWKGDTLKKFIERKFNIKGFYILKKNKDNIYNSICFGKGITFDFFIQEFKKKNIYYDGYSQIDGRWRGVFRASKKWWDDLIIEEYS